VANALLFAVKIPVFTVGLDVSSEASATPRRILHPVSLRGHYREASAFALQLAQLYGAELTFMHLIDPSVMAGDYVETIFANTRKKLDELLPVSSFPPVHALTKAGNVTLEVLAVSAKEKMDWIVMEIEHDYPWWSMHNNHAGRVIAEAPCPVLTLRVGSLLAEATLADTEVAHAAPSSM
jgi:nucleotide-binding universal stress UspA family protein